MTETERQRAVNVTSNRKTMISSLVLAAASALSPVLTGCSQSSTRGDAEADGPAEPVVDGTSDAHFEWPDVTDATSPDLERPEPEATCGDGALDPGEECDDGNRLDGDGCDWLCRLGDGETPPDPDPMVGDYEPDGDTILVEGDGTVEEPQGTRRPSLTWTGSEYAVAYPEDAPEEGLPYHIRLLRLDPDGSPVDGGWIFELPSPSRGVDILWTGDSFGLFFDLDDAGIYLLRLDENGKPLGDPVLVEADPAAHFPAADIAPSSFVLVWQTSSPHWYSCIWRPECATVSDSICSTRIRLVGLDGSTASLPGPVIVQEPSVGPPDVASGSDGFGITTGENRSTSEEERCSFRFLRANATLTSFRYSGILSDGRGGDVVWSGDHFATAWMSHEREPDLDTCLARFDADGDLERAPVCTRTWTTMTPSGFNIGRTVLAAGDRGMGIVFFPASDVTGAHPWFMRTDMDGVPISPMQWSEHGVAGWNGKSAIAWGGDAFGVVFRATPNLWFQRFVAAD